MEQSVATLADFSDETRERRGRRLDELIAMFRHKMSWTVRESVRVRLCKYYYVYNYVFMQDHTYGLLRMLPGHGLLRCIRERK